MGQPADGVIQIEFTSEKFANEGKLQAEKFDEYLKKRLEDEYFSTNIYDISVDGSVLDIKLGSSRIQNAEWQCEQVSEMFKELFKDKLVSIVADIVVSENLIYWEAIEGIDE